MFCFRNFKIGNSNSNYNLMVGSYSGTAGNRSWREKYIKRYYFHILSSFTFVVKKIKKN